MFGYGRSIANRMLNSDSPDTLFFKQNSEKQIADSEAASPSNSSRQNVRNHKFMKEYSHYLSHSHQWKPCKTTKWTCNPEKNTKINSPCKTQVSFRSQTTDLNVSNMLILMKAMISKHFQLICNNFQIFIVHPPKIKISLWKIAFWSEQIFAQCNQKY